MTKYQVIKQSTPYEKALQALFHYLRSHNYPFYYFQELENHLYTIPAQEEKISTINFILYKLKNNVPIEYILNNTRFMGLDFYVNRCTHIPKPLTETLVENILRFLLPTENTTDFYPIIHYAPTVIDENGKVIPFAINKKPNDRLWAYTNVKNVTMPSKTQLTIVDMGTGSGNIIISLAYFLQKYKKILFKQTTFIGTDIYSCTLNIAEYNVRRYNLEKKISFIQNKKEKIASPVLINILRKNNPQIIIWVTNPPYLTQKDELPPDVLKQPKASLFEPEDFSNHLINSLKKLAKHFKTNIFLFNEKDLFESIQTQK